MTAIRRANENAMTLPAPEWSVAHASFGPFRLYPAQRVLLEDGRPLKLGSRAFDILAVLAERAGAPVSKSDLIARAWPDTIVEEANLRVHVAALRKALRETPERRYIGNLAGHGYTLLAAVQWHAPASDPPHDNPADGGALADSLAALAQQHLLVTLTGTAGVGKSTLAHALARQLATQFRTWSIDLAEAADPWAALAGTMGLSRGTDPVSALLAHVRECPVLLVLDNCDRIVTAAAALAEQLLRDVPGLCIVATCREALRAAGERVQRVAPLDCPPPGTEPASAAAALAYPAVALFAARAAALHGGFTLADADAPAVAELCRRLDGVPLAIELAAGRLDLFHPRELLARIDERLEILKGGRRTAPPRHRSLRASLEWSIDTLSPVERTVLCRVAMFTGPFTLARAVRVAAGEAVTGQDVEDALATLAARSLLAPHRADSAPQCLLYDSVRTCALSLLAPDDAAFARFTADCAALAGVDSDPRHLPDVRAALAWGFGAHGDPQAAAALLAASIPMWWEAAELAELRDWLAMATTRGTGPAEPAMRHMPGQAPLPSLPPSTQAVLHTALGTVSVYLEGAGAGQAAYARGFALAEACADTERLADAFSGLVLEHVLTGDYPAAVALAQRFQHDIRHAGSRPAQLVHDRFAALALHLSGEQALAAPLAHAVQNGTVPAVCTRRRTALHTDENVAASAVLARARWLLGYPDEALRLARNGVLRARAVGADAPLCQVLAFAMFPVAWWCGDRPAALAALAELEDAARRFPHWETLARQYRHGIVEDAPGGWLAQAPTAGPHRETLATLNPRYLDETLLLRADQGGARWCAPELRRLQGERLLATGGPAARDGAERQFRAALLLARNQGALSWELRAATSLARLWHGHGATSGAEALLELVLARFTGGHGTADLLAATRLLGQWRLRKKTGAASVDAAPVLEPGMPVLTA
ncbi:transcriptional regulator [Pseudoduganella albidiflava]|uniref:AAA family ATPase n=2 Tax=Pseudoduganella albidiflava TaxID=321983 RepID=A0A411WVE5_9BURK|nr:AAA family ATPase [Pseudoduganella albidiflava]GGY31102.1 transcriptional regulator [Pseudoduganella albidiflava]